MQRAACLGVILCIWLQGIASGQSSEAYVSDGEDLGMMIMGTIAPNKKQSAGVALIKELGSGKVSAVKPGFKIGDYSVREVAVKYIMLRKGKQDYLIYQNKFAGDFVGKRSVRSQRSSSLDEFKEPGFERTGNQVTMSEAYKKKTLEDLSNILMQATAIPHMESGRIVGFRILQIDAGSIYDKAGLRNNDVVTSINGTKLTNVAGAIRLLQTMKGASDFEIEIVRSGQNITKRLTVAH